MLCSSAPNPESSRFSRSPASRPNRCASGPCPASSSLNPCYPCISLFLHAPSINHLPLTPLESALTKISPITRLESALPKTKDLKPFIIRTYEISGGEGSKLLTRIQPIHLSRTGIVSRRSGNAVISDAAALTSKYSGLSSRKAGATLSPAPLLCIAFSGLSTSSSTCAGANQAQSHHRSGRRRSGRHRHASHPSAHQLARDRRPRHHRPHRRRLARRRSSAHPPSNRNYRSHRHPRRSRRRLSSRQFQGIHREVGNVSTAKSSIKVPGILPMATPFTAPTIFPPCLKALPAIKASSRRCRALHDPHGPSISA